MTNQQSKQHSVKRPKDVSAMEESLKKEIALIEIFHADEPPLPVLLVPFRWQWIMEDEGEGEEQID